MNIKLVMKFVGYVVAFISCVFISVLINLYINEDLGTLLIWLIFLIFPLRLFVWLRKRSNENENKRNIEFVKKPLEKHDSLFTWLGEEKNTDKIIFELVGSEYIEQQSKEYKTVEALNVLKGNLKSQIGENLEDYYIIRGFLENSKRDSFGEFMKSIINKLAIGTIIYAAVKAVLENETLLDFLKMDLPNLPIKIVVFILYTVMFLAIIFDITMKSKIRYNVVTMVLNEIIKEKELNNRNE